MTIDFELQAFSDGWNDFAESTNPDSSLDILDWDKPAPPDESWTDPLGLQAKENSGTLVEQKADGTSQSVARTWLEDYMRDKPDPKRPPVDQTIQSQSEKTVADTLLNEQPKQLSGGLNSVIQATPLVAGALAGGASRRKAGSPSDQSNASASSKESSLVQLPTLNAAWVDDAFKRQNEEFKYSGPNANSEIRGDWAGHKLQWRNENLGWDLGYNNEGSFIRRGAAALGVTDPTQIYAPTKTASGEGDVNIGPSAYDHYRMSAPTASEAEVQRKAMPTLFAAAEQAGIDLSQYEKPFDSRILGQTGGDYGPQQDIVTPASVGYDVERLYADLDKITQNIYRVGGIYDNLPGSPQNGGQIVESFYMRDGDKLVPVGTQRSYKSKENSAGFVGDMMNTVKDFGMDIMSDPLLAGIVSLATAGAAAPLSGTIATATGMGTAASTAAANALISAGTAAVTGGNPLKAALTAGAMSGISQFNPGGQIAPNASAAVQKGINNVIGGTISTGNPLTALKRAGVGMATGAIAPDIAKAISEATGIDVRNASQITNWAIKNTPALLQGKNLNPNQIAGLISASIPKRSKA